VGLLIQVAAGGFLCAGSLFRVKTCREKAMDLFYGQLAQSLRELLHVLRR